MDAETNPARRRSPKEAGGMTRYEALEAILSGKGTDAAYNVFEKEDANALRDTRESIEKERLDLCLALQERLQDLDVASALLTICRWNLELETRLKTVEERLAAHTTGNQP